MEQETGDQNSPSSSGLIFSPGIVEAERRDPQVLGDPNIALHRNIRATCYANFDLTRCPVGELGR